MEPSLCRVESRDIYTDGLLKCRHSSFLQSWEWGEFQESVGNKVERVCFKDDNGEIVGVATLIFTKSRFGTFAYIPRGPAFDWKLADMRSSIVKSLIDFVRGKVIFLRIEPAVIDGDGSVNQELLRVGFVNAVRFIHGYRMWILDVAKSAEEEILKGMRKNTRYYIRKAEKKGVEVFSTQDEEYFEKFYTMLKGLADKKGFRSLPKSYLHKEFKQFAVETDSGPFMKLFFAKKGGDLLATAWIMFFNGEASYLHAATTDKGAKYDASYLLQWEIIKYVKKLGFDRYNFWGVVDEKNYHPGHPGFGYSNFKRGFGGHLEQYIFTKEYPFNLPMYGLSRLQEWWRKHHDKGL